VVHFIGDGSPTGAIISEDQGIRGPPVSPDAHRRLFATLKDTICCVVLDSCSSGGGASTHTRRSAHGPSVAQIDHAIRGHDKLMLVFTEDSIASDWVESEPETTIDREGREKRIVLFSIRLDDAVLESPFVWASHVKRTRDIGDFTGWKDHDAYQRAFDRLLRDLRTTEVAK
jgi:hypothetical protein